MNRTRTLVTFAGLSATCASLASAAVVPYTPDTNTVVLYHFDESAGLADPGNRFVNAGTAGSSHDLSNTGGPDGRDNTGGGGYGATAYSGFGSAFNSLASGNNTYHFGTTGTGSGGGAITSGAVTQASLQGANGAFTHEALINLTGISDEQTIISHDGGGTNPRGFMLRVVTGSLNFFYPTSSSTNASITAAIPTVGDHAFATNEWFHIAVTYDGNAGIAGSLKFYWTRLDSGATLANQVGLTTLSLANDLLSGADANSLGVGTITRSPFRFEPHLVDEVRISNIARAANEFFFAVPEPTTLVLSLAGLALIGRRGRSMP